jgi:hypothetical protein
VKEEIPEEKCSDILIIPLCWDDAISSPVSRVISPRGDFPIKLKSNYVKRIPNNKNLEFL